MTPELYKKSRDWNAPTHGGTMQVEPTSVPKGIVTPGMNANPFHSPSTHSRSTSESSTTEGISVWTASAMVVAAMVGTGVYVGLGYQVMGLPSGFPILLIWLLGGIWAFCGSLCYAELAAMFPRSGGEYNLLGQAAHPLLGYLAGWVSLLAGFVAPAALGASVFGTYLDGITPTAPVNIPMIGDVSLGRIAAIAALIAIAAIQFGSLSLNSTFLNVFTWSKVALIGVIIFAGFALADSTGIGFLPRPGDRALVFSHSFGISMIYVSYAYAGWNTSTYIVGEVRDPQRNVPRSLLMGTLIVTALYIGLNAAFLNATPIKAIQGLENKEEVGLLAAQHIFGNAGGKLIGCIIAMGMISFIGSMLWAGPRIMQTMGEDHRLFSVFAKRNRYGSPAAAVAVSATIALGLLLINQFQAVLTYTQFVLVLCNMATVGAMFWLRISQPNAHRPYRALGYPVVPVLFLLCGAVILRQTYIEQPKASLLGAATVLLPIPFYFLKKK